MYDNGVYVSRSTGLTTKTGQPKVCNQAKRYKYVVRNPRECRFSSQNVRYSELSGGCLWIDTRIGQMPIWQILHSPRYRRRPDLIREAPPPLSPSSTSWHPCTPLGKRLLLLGTSVYVVQCSC